MGACNGYMHLNNRIQNTINSEDSYQCNWRYGIDEGHDVAVWIGFDASITEYCNFLGDGTYGMSTGAPSTSPTPAPTDNPTKGPTKKPSTDPSQSPTSLNPTLSPSSNPTA